MQELSADCYMSRDKKTNCQGPVLGMSLICFLLCLSLVQYVVSCPAARAPLAWRQDVWQASDRGSCRSLVASACESRSCSLPFSHANSCGKWARGLGGRCLKCIKVKKVIFYTVSAGCAGQNGSSQRPSLLYEKREILCNAWPQRDGMMREKWLSDDFFSNVNFISCMMR